MGGVARRLGAGVLYQRGAHPSSGGVPRGDNLKNSLSRKPGADSPRTQRRRLQEVFSTRYRAPLRGAEVAKINLYALEEDKGTPRRRCQGGSLLPGAGV